MNRLFERNPNIAFTAWQTIQWWELRRIAYNIIIGGVGVFTVLLFLLSAYIGETYYNVPIGLPDPPIFMILGIIIFGTMANVCYTFGWIGELIIKSIQPKWSNLYASKILFWGVLFSIFVTLSPLIILVIGWWMYV